MRKGLGFREQLRPCPKGADSQGSTVMGVLLYVRLNFFKDNFKRRSTTVLNAVAAVLADTGVFQSKSNNQKCRRVLLSNSKYTKVHLRAGLRPRSHWGPYSGPQIP